VNPEASLATTVSELALRRAPATTRSRRRTDRSNRLSSGAPLFWDTEIDVFDRPWSNRRAANYPGSSSSALTTMAHLGQGE